MGMGEVLSAGPDRIIVRDSTASRVRRLSMVSTRRFPSYLVGSASRVFLNSRALARIVHFPSDWIHAFANLYVTKEGPRLCWRGVCTMGKRVFEASSSGFTFTLVLVIGNLLSSGTTGFPRFSFLPRKLISQPIVF
jgi:hypothetical protein